MIGNKIPRYLRFGLTLGVAVATIMLSMFYGQYRWLAQEITSTSTAEHDAFLRGSYERRVRAQMHTAADSLSSEIGARNSASVLSILNRAIADNETLAGLRFISSDLDMRQAGSLPDVDISDAVTWLPDNLVMTYPVVHANDE